MYYYSLIISKLTTDIRNIFTRSSLIYALKSFQFDVQCLNGEQKANGETVVHYFLALVFLPILLIMKKKNVLLKHSDDAYLKKKYFKLNRFFLSTNSINKIKR